LLEIHENVCYSYLLLSLGLVESGHGLNYSQTEKTSYPMLLLLTSSATKL